jgi:hypothetical protein
VTGNLTCSNSLADLEARIRAEPPSARSPAPGSRQRENEPTEASAVHDARPLAGSPHESIEAFVAHCLRQRPTPQTVVEAVWYCVRERGLAALREPANLQRLATFDSAARAQLNERIAKAADQKLGNGEKSAS